MKYYNLKCEVPGAIGKETVYEKSVVPWKIKYLHISFDGWLGANLMVSSSAVMVTEKLKNALGFNFTGVMGYEHFGYEKSENFKILQPDVFLPKMTRVHIGEKPFIDDFALTYYNKLYNQLIISENARIFLDDFDLGNHRIEPIIIN